MCGIWGFVSETETIDTADGWAGLCALEDRGPDDWGMYVEGHGKVTERDNLPSGECSTLIGNRRLSILDLSDAGNQPMGSDDTGWIVYNGEIYNYQELRADLRERGCEFESDTDTEVVLRAYEEFGEDCVEWFEGMFAFAILDPEAGTLFAARDRFGIKPFYFDTTGERLAFASEVTALLDSGVSVRALDRRGVDGFLAFGYVPTPLTIVEDVDALPPGTTLKYNLQTDEIETNVYWQPTFDGQTDTSPDRIRDLLEESVSLRLRSDVPVGAFLSGGLDSSSIVAIMRELERERDDIHTFSVGFDHPGYSEADYAGTVADAFGTDHTATTVTADEVDQEFPAIIEAMDQPTIDGVNTYFVSKAARDAGIKVALSGLGSDELFYGYPQFEQVAEDYSRFRRLFAIPRRVRVEMADLLERLDSVVPVVPGRRVADVLRARDPFGAAYEISRGIFPTNRRRELLVGEADPIDWSDSVGDTVMKTLREADATEAMSHAELTWYMQSQLLRDTDAMSMAHSLEVRVPFLDTAFAEEAFRTDSETKRIGEKQLLKGAMANSLPDTVLERDKSGFVFPFETWLDDELHHLVTQITEEPGPVERSGIDYERTREIERAFRAGEVHWSRMWALVILVNWVETHITEE